MYAERHSILNYNGYRCESGETIATEVYLQENPNQLYPSGTHTFVFTLIVPSSTAPYERCEHGKIEHRVVAVAEAEGFTKPKVEASAPIHLVVNPAP